MLSNKRFKATIKKLIPGMKLKTCLKTMSLISSVPVPSKLQSPSWLYPRPQLQQAFLKDPLARPASEAGRQAETFTVPSLLQMSSPSLMVPHLCSRLPAKGSPQSLSSFPED